MTEFDNKPKQGLKGPQDLGGSEDNILNTSASPTKITPTPNAETTVSFPRITVHEEELDLAGGVVKTIGPNSETAVITLNENTDSPAAVGKDVRHRAKLGTASRNPAKVIRNDEVTELVLVA